MDIYSLWLAWKTAVAINVLNCLSPYYKRCSNPEAKYKTCLHELKGNILSTIWTDINMLNPALRNFIMRPDNVPEGLDKQITDWNQWIDYWAIDWNYANEVFNNQWQTCRRRQDIAIELSAAHEYDKSGKYKVMVKVTDILGNDTCKLIEIAV